jgi:hypothetical protein
MTMLLFAARIQFSFNDFSSFADIENMRAVFLGSSNKLIAPFKQQMGNIERGHGIGAQNLQKSAAWQLFQRPGSAQYRQGAFQSA